MSTPFSEPAKMPHAEGTWPAIWAKSSQDEPCCDLHGRNCEPLSELCCGECTEASHDAIGFRTGVHEDGTPCSRPNLSANTVEEAGRREMAGRVARIRAHLEHLLGVADAATAPPWKVWGMHVLADRGGKSDLADSDLVAITYSPHTGHPRTFNADLIAAGRTAVPELAVALLKVLDWLESAADVEEPVREAAVAAEGICLLDDAIDCNFEPADLQSQLLAALRRAGQLAQQLPEGDRQRLFANGMSGWSRAGLERALQGASEYIVALSGAGETGQTAPGGTRA